MQIRDLTVEDELAWRRLWTGYIEFYEAEVPEHVTQATWTRLLDPKSSVIGRVAELDSSIVGFTLSVLHEGTWTLMPICYLEDLFVDPDCRGGGIGRSLIEDLVTQATERGWSRLYWHTKKDNERARRLYDSFNTADDFVRYLIRF